ncbi:MAG: diaminopimelate decarboxylase [Dehalococcoidales bacterium]|nr:MAG: diaminopimelate decarboxylase [Dehalococcoidales bacterium]
MMSRLPLFPSTGEVNDRGHLVIGGCDVVDLAAEFGTPLYLFDETSLRDKCREFKDAFGSRYADITVVYSCKAFTNKSHLLLVNEEGVGLDVVSGGELGIAHSVDFPMEQVYFSGNNKSREELRQSLELGLGRVVVDNFHELKMLGELVNEMGCTQDILLRLSPAVDPHTHKYITTGNIDSKFGIPLVLGEDAVVEAMSMPGLNLLGLHFHIGSLIFEVEPYQESIKNLLGLAAEMKRKHGFELKELDIGGGFAVQYTLDAPAPPVSFYAEAITSTIIAGCRELGLKLPRLVVEPGRSMVARAGLAVYTAGVVKDIPNVRRYVSVDGGMADNIRPALYQARHEAVVANKMPESETGKVTIAGKFCESGDILIWDIGLPPIVAGDIIAVPGCGAFCLTEAMNYNASFKPPVVMVREGKARLIRRRETLEDLTRCDVV